MGLCDLDSTCYPATPQRTRTLTVRGSKAERETTPYMSEVDPSLWFQRLDPHDHLPEPGPCPSCTGPGSRPGTSEPTTGFRQRIRRRCSGIRPGRMPLRRAHARCGRQGKARLAGNRQKPAARKGFDFAEGILPECHSDGACIGVSQTTVQL